MQLIRLKYVATEVRQVGSYDRGFGLPYIGLEHIESYTGRLIIDPSVKPTGSVSHFRRDHILFGKLRPYLAKVALPDFDGTCSTEAIVLKTRPGYEPRFLRYVLLSKPFLDEVSISTYGAKMPRTSWEFMRNRLVPNPTPEEQKRIADFLDRETARIDELIFKKERLANLVDSKWSATVDHATTRGVAPPGIRRDTTSDDVNHVPSHWAVVALKRIAGIRYGISEPPEYRSDGVPLIRATNIRRGKIELNDVVFVNPNDIPPSRIVWLSPGDIIVVRSGAYTGDSALVRREHCPAIAGFDMVLTPKQCDPEFLQFVLLSSYVLDGQIGFYKMRAAQPHLNAAELGSLRIYLPPKEEQRHIVGYLNSQLARLERLREATLESIRKLRELRSALITCAVTGQIDIEEWRRRGEGERRMDMAEVELPEA